ncbi:MAG TPA: NAD(P)/FAD-dependent oxidoreductase [Bradyrhizobium sp.]|uniref:FAD-dependent oxidoreductase n=1 Tax=Bradyrhizobium sp. TaxID=376 RepID=UPI002D7E6A8E|nr:NAD(P)/FAD-dependent oxidoreductase [Bradyrhizobium sp.]HET7888076.1 NAD(P)/FAD-dependent oxidoreductase [Bradyrhizobium sp.]
MRIVIVGAGVAGCVMARKLSQLDGVEVVCLERVAPDDHSEAGTGLNVGPNAVKALKLADPALAAAITDASFAWTSWRISLTDGTELFNLKLKDVADGPGWRIRWSELYRVLREAARPTVHYACEIADVGRDPSNPRKTEIAWTQDGKQHRLGNIDLLIAADGRYSRIRRLFSGEPAIRHTGVAISRVLVADTSRGLIDDYEQWFNGPKRLLAFRVPPAHIYIACAFPIDPDADIPAELKTPQALRAAYTPSGAPPSDQAAWMIDQVCNNVEDTHWARMQEHDALYHAQDCNVLYLGDAAHGMVPTLGQGATQAIEDAAVASTLIARRHAQGRHDVSSWLKEIAALREQRMRFVMEFSLAATDTMMEGADPVAGTRKKTEAPFIDRLKALYNDIGLPLNSAEQEQGETP